MSLLNTVDHAVLEPVVRWLFPEPTDRKIGRRVIWKGRGEIRLLCLSGAFCVNTAANWAGWVKDLRRRFPDAEITAVNGFYYYWPEEAPAIEQLIAEGQRVLADRKPTVIIAFSFGGLLAKAMVSRSSDHDVRAILSLATEHRGHLPRIAEMRDDRLGVPLDVAVPLHSFGGWFDPIVWPWTSFADRSAHRFLANGHFAFLRSARTRREVLRTLDEIVAGIRDDRCETAGPKTS